MTINVLYCNELFPKKKDGQKKTLGTLKTGIVLMFLFTTTVLTYIFINFLVPPPPFLKTQTAEQVAINPTTAPAESLDRWGYLAVSLSKHTLIFPFFLSKDCLVSLSGSSIILSGEADSSLSERKANLPLFCLPVVRFPCCLCPLGAGSYWMSRQAENGSEI